MCCPYFEPLQPLSGTGPRSAILPLGDVWSGTCNAADSWQPDSYRLVHVCNLGYARGQCNRFPSGDGPDAVRFVIRGEEGDTLRVDYAIERDHHPFAHGALSYSLGAAAFNGSIEGWVAAQARAYIESYLRRREPRDGR